MDSFHKSSHILGPDFLKAGKIALISYQLSISNGQVIMLKSQDSNMNKLVLLIRVTANVKLHVVK